MVFRVLSSCAIVLSRPAIRGASNDSAKMSTASSSVVDAASAGCLPFPFFFFFAKWRCSVVTTGGRRCRRCRHVAVGVERCSRRAVRASSIVCVVAASSDRLLSACTGRAKLCIIVLSSGDRGTRASGAGRVSRLLRDYVASKLGDHGFQASGSTARGVGLPGTHSLRPQQQAAPTP